MQFEKFHYGTREIVVFVDEAGDRRLLDPGNPLFVLAGCACWGRDVGSSIREPWMAVREAILGDREKPIHMREISGRFGSRRLAAMKNFFEIGSFKRISFGVTERTLFDNGNLPQNPVLELSLEFFLKSVSELMTSHEPAEALSIIFEDGPLTGHIKKHWGNRVLTRSDGVQIPVSWAILGKDENEPALEVADYIAHSTAGFLRSQRDPNSKFAQRYASIFPPDRTLVRALELNSARYEEPSSNIKEAH